MGFEEVRTYQFRNLSEKVIDTRARNIFLIGKNGQGKSNFLEAVYFLCYGSSFRSKQEKILGLNGKSDFSARGIFSSENQAHKIFVKWDNGKKEILLDDNLIKDRKEVIRAMPCIAFTHEDFLFVSGPPERQRYFIDQTLSLYDFDYIDGLRKYKKLLKTRNFLLRGGDATLLDLYESQMVTAGLYLQKRRKESNDEFNVLFTELFHEVSGIKDTLKILYSPSWKFEEKEKILDALREKREQDRILGTTSQGPHRDRFRFISKGKDFVETASTGQIRLISLVLRSAQANYFALKTGRKPILLLDDVLLELDDEKRTKFIRRMPDYDQAFFTFLPDQALSEDFHNEGMIYWVEVGELKVYEDRRLSSEISQQ